MKPDRKPPSQLSNPVGQFAVMRVRSVSKKAYFTAMHETYESARSEAERLSAESVATHGAREFSFLIMEVRARIGIIDGKLTS